MKDQSSVPVGDEATVVRATRLTLSGKSDAIFEEGVIHVEINDEAAGEFVVIRQNAEGNSVNSIAIDPRQWPHLKAAVEFLIAQCRD